MHFTKETISFLSADRKTRVAAYLYTPLTAPKAIFQISHGMCEYIGRYEHMIDVLCADGYAVCGNDHLGHGDTGDPKDWGFFAEKDGYDDVLQDLHTMNSLARGKWPGLPLVFYGHSMGSFYARWYAEKYPETIDALVISGTGGPGPLPKAGKAMASGLCRIFGPRHVSELMLKASTGSYAKGAEEGASPSVWLSRDPAVWAKYDADPKCRFKFTVSAYRDMLTAHVHVNSKAWAEAFPKDMPTYFLSGDADPVGENGKGVTAACQLLKDAGVKDVTLKLYKDARHELHNETNKEEVFADLLAWCDSRIGAEQA